MLAITHRKNKRKDISQSYTSKSNQKGKGRIPPQAYIKKENKCFFYKKKGHLKKYCYESNMVNVITNTWWIDYGFAIHIAKSLQGMQNLRKPMGSELTLLLGNKIGSHVEAIGTCTLTLSKGFVLVLEMTFYVPMDKQVQYLPHNIEQTFEPQAP